MQHPQAKPDAGITNGDRAVKAAGGTRGGAIAMAIAATIIAALQPVVMRYGALNIDPLWFCTIAVTAAGICAALLLGYTGELKLLIRREYLARLILLSITGTFATSLLLIYGLRRIDAVAGVILLESEPIYSLVLATLFLGERPSLKQLVATAVILIGIGRCSALDPPSGLSTPQG